MYLKAIRAFVLAMVLGFFCRNAAGTVGALVNFKEWSLDEKVSQLFILGFRDLKEVEDLKPGGVILFSWNLPDLDRTRELTRNLQNLSYEKLRVPLFISTDHEGGQVLRLRKGITPFPDALTVGSLNDPYQAFRFGKLMGHELSLLGINMNLAPVLDLGNARSFLANRVWGDNPSEVAQSTLGFIRGSLAAGVIPVAKHFPGHGLNSKDSHFSLPQINKSLSRLWTEELEPFRKAVAVGVPALMTAHVQIPAVDRLPASLSKRFITDILRNQLQYDGLVISDDLEMAGAQRGLVASQPESLVLQALEAGTDMVMIVWSKSVQRRAMAAVKAAVQSGRLSEEWLNQKLTRILTAKQRYLPLVKLPENPYWQMGLLNTESRNLVEALSSRALTWLTPNKAQVLGGLHREWSRSWRVYVPSKSDFLNWKKFRPQDQIVILPKRPGIAELKYFRNNFGQDLKGNKPFLIMTGPRALASEELFGELRTALNIHLKRASLRSASTILWVHQGAQPIRLSKKQSEVFKDLGILTLHGSGESNVHALTKHLKFGVEDEILSGEPPANLSAR